MTSLLKRFPTGIWFLQIVVLVVALFLGLVLYIVPDPTQGIVDGKYVGHDLMQEYGRREVPVPFHRPKRFGTDPGSQSNDEVSPTGKDEPMSEGTSIPGGDHHVDQEDER